MPGRRNLEVRLTLKDDASRDLKNFTSDTSRNVKSMGQEVNRVSKDMENSWKSTNTTLKSVGRTVSETSSQIRTSTAGMATNMTAYTTSVNNASTAIRTLNTNSTTASNSTEQMRNSMDKFNESAKKSTSSTKNLAGTIRQANGSSKSMSDGIKRYNSTAKNAVKSTNEVGKAARNSGAQIIKLSDYANNYRKSANNAAISTKEIGKATTNASKAAQELNRNFTGVVSTNRAALTGMTNYTNAARRAGEAVKKLGTELRTSASIRVGGGVGGGAGGGAIAAGGSMVDIIQSGLLAKSAISSSAATAKLAQSVRTTYGEMTSLAGRVADNEAGLRRYAAAGVHLGKTYSEMTTSGVNMQKSMANVKNTISRLREDYKTLGASAEQARQRISRVFRGGHVDDIGQWTNSLKEANNSIQQQSGFIGLLKNRWVRLGATAATVGIIIKKAVDLGVMGAQFEQTRQAFDNLVMAMGANSSEVIADMKRLSANTIGELELMQKAGTAMMLGIDPSRIAELMEIARATAKITGQEVSDAFGDIALAVARQSKMILDNLGIIVTLEEAYKSYADTLGKSAKDLTEAEKKQAFLNATIEKGQELVERIGMKQTSAAEKTKSFGVAIGELATAIGQHLAPVVGNVSAALGGLINKMTEAIKPAITLEERIRELEILMQDVATDPNTAYNIESLREQYAQLILQQQQLREESRLKLETDRLELETANLLLNAKEDQLKMEEALKTAKENSLRAKERELELQQQINDVMYQAQLAYLEATQQTAARELMIMRDKYNKMIQQANAHKEAVLSIYRAQIAEIIAIMSKLEEKSPAHNMWRQELERIKGLYNALAAEGSGAAAKIEAEVKRLLGAHKSLDSGIESNIASYESLGSAASSAAAAASSSMDSASDSVESGVNEINQYTSALQPIMLDVDMNLTPAMNALEFLEQEAHSMAAGLYAEMAMNIAGYEQARGAGVTGAFWSTGMQRNRDLSRLQSLEEYYNIGLRQLGGSFELPHPSDMFERPYWQAVGAEQPTVKAPGYSTPSYPSYQIGTGIKGLPKDGMYFGHRGEIVLNKEESDEYRKGGDINITISPTFMNGDRKSLQKAAEFIRRELQYQKGRRS